MCHDNARTGLEDSVVLDELRERYRLVVVDLHRCIEDTLVRRCEEELVHSLVFSLARR